MKWACYLAGQKKIASLTTGESYAETHPREVSEIDAEM